MTPSPPPSPLRLPLALAHPRPLLGRAPPGPAPPLRRVLAAPPPRPAGPVRPRTGVSAGEAEKEAARCGGGGVLRGAREGRRAAVRRRCHGEPEWGWDELSFLSQPWRAQDPPSSSLRPWLEVEAATQDCARLEVETTTWEVVRGGAATRRRRWRSKAKWAEQGERHDVERGGLSSGAGQRGPPEVKTASRGAHCLEVRARSSRRG
ncbi:hypothetical protein U9M48_018597 [Paspalum notatum var. saurae]|uniref:Uncharacterized protein n=1 Tax=Paspalum notatum var. saurae TaxID=547442 RepID=A0AAQ3WQN5_PASNO